MLSEEIKGFFSQQNFLLMQTNINGMTVMKNSDDTDDIYVVLLDNVNGQIWSTKLVASVNAQIINQTVYPRSPHILFIVVTEDVSRDRYLAQLEGVKLWFADAENRKLFIYENQPDDFYGFRYGLELTVNAAKGPGSPFDIKRILKNKKDLPFVTIALIVANVVYFIILSALGDISDTQYMWSMGANYGYSVFKDFEFYRLVVSMFMHFSFAHLLGNMLYLAVAGNQAERAIGHLRFFLIYMLSGIGASLISAAYYYLTDQNTVSAGASGAIYGVIGIILYLTAVNRGRMTKKQMTYRISVVLVFLIYSNLINIGTGTDVVAHLAGFVFGALLSFAFLGSAKKKHSG